MTTFYVDWTNGSDANNGLGPDASAGTNKPWKTLSKALGASGIASGDTVYLAPGVMRGTTTVAMTSATVETKVLGDPLNAQGFKTSAGVLVSPDEVRVSAYTTNDKTFPSASVLLNLSARDHLTFRYITFVGGANNVIKSTALTSTDITFQYCTFLCDGVNADAFSVIRIIIGFGVAANWTIDSCRFLGGSTSENIYLSLTAGSGSDYDANITVSNCVFLSGLIGLEVDSTGAGAQEGGGVHVTNCTFVCTHGDAVATTSTSVGGSTHTFPVTVYGSAIYAANSFAISAAEAGAIVEDYNVIACVLSLNNVTAGAHSISDGSYAVHLLSIGQELVSSQRPRPAALPLKGSPLLGFGSDGTFTVTLDVAGITRPAGGASPNKSVGAYERPDTWTKETTTVQSGSNAISVVGPGTQDFFIPVNAVSTTLSVYLRYDSTYAGTRPQIQLIAEPEIGVTAQTVTASVAALNAWEKVSLAAFTPTGQGIVTVRLISNDTNGGGKAFADSFAVA